MATPSFNLNYTVLSTCDDGTGWSVGDVDTSIKVQGVASGYDAIRDGGTVTFTPGTAQDMSGTDVHLRLYLMHTFFANLEPQANGGIQLFVSDGSNTNYYYVGGSDTHNGAWQLFQANLAAPDINGGANLAAITECGFVLVHAISARNVDNTYWDYFVFGTGYEVYGGSDVDPITWDSLAAADAAAGYGVVQRINGVFFINGELKLGDSLGTGDCYFDGGGEVAVFYANGESSTLYKLNGTGNTTGITDIDIAGTVIKSASSAFAVDMSDINIDALSFDGTTIGVAGIVTFKAGQSITSCVFDGCDQIIPSTSTFTGNNVKNYAGTEGAILWPSSGSNISDCTLSDNTRAIEHDTVGTYSYTSMSFSGNTYNIHNTSTGLVTINPDAGSNPGLSGDALNSNGGTTTVNAVQTSFNFDVADAAGNPLTGYEWRLYEDSGLPGQLGTVALAGEESATASAQTYSYGYSIDTDVVLQVMLAGYIEYIGYFTLTANTQDISVVLASDPNI